MKQEKSGCIIAKEMVSDVNFKADIFTITTNLNTYTAAIVIGAFGKDQILM
jgi:thioredoxin reductase